jgi:membrane protein
MVETMDRKEFAKIAKMSLHRWQTHNATIRAAAIAFFTVMPLPSLLVISAAIFAIVYGAPHALDMLVSQINTVAGPAIAQLVRDLLQSAQNPFTSIFGSFLSVAFAVAGAIGAFSVLQDTLNIIWDVPPQKGRSLKTRIRERIFPFILVSIAVLIVLAWTSISTLLTSSLSVIVEPVIGHFSAVIITGAQILSSFIISTLLFGFIYTQIPDTEVEWGDVWLASVIVGFISTLLNYLFGIYVHTFPVTTVAGAAGSLILILLWIFVTDMFLLFGAHFSNVYSEIVGSHSRKVELESIPKRLIEIQKKLNELKLGKSDSESAQSLNDEMKNGEAKVTENTTKPQSETIALEEIDEEKARKLKTEDEEKISEPSLQIKLTQKKSEEDKRTEYDLTFKWKPKDEDADKNKKKQENERSKD